MSAVRGDEKVPAEKAREVDRLDVVWILCLLHECDGPHNEDQEIRVLLDLDAGLGIEAVLYRERMKVKDFAQERYSFGIAHVDVHP
jgi:hypothetical protein